METSPSWTTPTYEVQCVTLVVIDYGAANLGSVCRALRRLGADPYVSADPADLQAATHIVLPGVGSFADCARNLRDGGWVQAIQTQVREHNKAMLGVCVGMQLLADEGTEWGVHAGLGLVPGRVQRLNDLGCKLRIPHVGWNELSVRAGQDHLLRGVPSGSDMYFVHSYAMHVENPEDLWATVDYGVPLAAVVGRNRVMGVQFHPEKSSKAGLKVLRNFLDIPVAAPC
jgi:imidazole glycerol-phosphate synthase subunit HisH